MVGVWDVSGWRRTVGRGIAAASIVVVACGGGDQRGGGIADTAGGEVAALKYEVTPDRYERWVGAQQSLDAITGLPAPPKIDPMRLTEADIDRAVAYLEGDARARAALARAGISARDYVLTTVALDQALVAAATPSGGDPGAVAPPGAGPATAAPSAAGRAPGAPTAGSGATGRSASSAGTVTAVRAPPRVTGAPAQNVELVRRNRADVVRVLRTMRFRISEPAAAELSDVGDTAVTRSDSVRVGKDVTVKWDVTVRRNRDTTGTKAPATRSDTTRRGSSKPDSSSH